MEPYRYEDPDGDMLVIADRDGKPGVALVKAMNGAEVKGADLPEITGKLYEACGLPAPVILPASSARFPENGDSFRFGDFGFKRYPGGVSPSLPGISAAVVPPDFLRELAAHLVALADDAEANPELDEDEINELAEAIHAGTHTEGCTLGPTIEHRAHAVSALRWMNGRRS